MKRMIVLVMLLGVCLSACSRVGKTDSLDLLAALEKRNIPVTFDEFVSDDGTRTESGVFGDVRFSAVSDANGRVGRVVLTCMDASDPDFLTLAQNLTEVYCSVSADFFYQIWQTLTADAANGGVQQCRTERYLFTYSADAVGAVFVVDDQLLRPTEAPTVTVRSTVPLLKEPETATR